VPGLTDAPDNVEGIASFVAALPSVERVDVLPFHKMGAPKYQAMGLPFLLADTPTPGSELVERVRGQFRAHGSRA
jgi:pyruvate formate lyase activating enzyme